MRRDRLRVDGISIFLYLPDEEPRAMAVLLKGFPSSTPKAATAPSVQALLRIGVGVLHPSYPGIQDSDGLFSPAEAVSCARRCVGILRSREQRSFRDELTAIPDVPILLLGASFGGSVALRAADASDGVIAVSPVTDLSLPIGETDEEMRAVCKVFYPHTVRLATDWADMSAVDCATIDSLSVPVTLIHGHADEMVPPVHSRAFAARHHLTAIILEQGGHLGLDEVPEDMLASLVLEMLE